MALQFIVDIGLLHISSPVLLIFGLHSPTAAALSPEVLLLLFCYPSFSWSFLFLPDKDFFIQDLSRKLIDLLISNYGFIMLSFSLSETGGGGRGVSEGIMLCKVVLSHTQPGRRHIPVNSGYEPDCYVIMSSCTP